MIRSFHALELTSRCNLRCRYCPQPTMARAKEDMADETFFAALGWLREFRQRELHLHNFGESTLHPRLVEYVGLVRDAVPFVGLSTNGVGVERALLKELKWAGLSRLSVSVHRPEAAQWAVAWALELGLEVDLADGPMRGTHDWAGQVQAPVTLQQPFRCDFLADQKAVVLADGRIAACCIDAEGKSARATVFDDLHTVSFRPFALCLGCHHAVPEDRFPGWREELAAEPGRPACTIGEAVGV